MHRPEAEGQAWCLISYFVFLKDFSTLSFVLSVKAECCILAQWGEAEVSVHGCRVLWEGQLGEDCKRTSKHCIWMI